MISILFYWFAALYFIAAAVILFLDKKLDISKMVEEECGGIFNGKNVVRLMAFIPIINLAIAWSAICDYFATVYLLYKVRRLLRKTGADRKLTDEERRILGFKPLGKANTSPDPKTP